MAVLLGCDYGRKRMGLAVSDPSESFVFSRPTLTRGTLDQDLESLRALCAEDAVERLVLGLPLNADGTEGEMAREVRAYGAQLEEKLGLPVVLHDERYTSLEADERLREQYRDRKKRKARRDQAAAAIILRSFLDREAS